MGVGVAKIIVTAVLLADMVSPIKPIPTHIQHTQSVEIVETQIETTVFGENWQKPQEYVGFVQYRVNGVLPPVEWEQWLWAKLEQFGIGWFYPTAVCQIYQESNWNQWADNGRDKGLCQQKGVYWASRAAQAGIPEADMWDVRAQIHVYVWQMNSYLSAAGSDVGRALSMYYLGYDGWSAEYVGHVMRWMGYLEVVR